METTIENTIAVNTKVLNLLTDTNTNWSVTKEPLISLNGKVTKSYGIFRADDNTWLNTVGTQYQPMQNSILAQTLVEATERLGINHLRGGELGHGKKVYYQSSLPDAMVGKDTIKRHLTMLNAHDGSSCIGVGSSSTVVICQNTFYMAMKQLDKLRHTFSAEDRLKMAMDSLTATILMDNNLMDDFKRMTEHSINKPILDKLINKLFGTTLEATRKDTSARKQGSLIKFSEVLEKEIESHGGANLWSLFNGVTYYTNHVDILDAKGFPKKDKLESVMVGSGAKSNLIAYDVIMDWIKENTVKPVFVG